MNVNNFFRTLFEDTLGLDVLGLENRFSDFVKLIDRSTLVTFSNLIPAYYMTYLDLEDSSNEDSSNIVKKDHNTLGVEYYIDDPVLNKFKLPILGVEKITPTSTSAVDPFDPESAAYYSSIIASRHNLTLEGVLMGSEYTYNRTLIDSAVPYKAYKELRGQRTLYLRNYTYSGVVELKLKVPWPNIVSIPEEYREILLTLAQFDIKIKLWNELKYMEDIVTPTGNLSLKVNDWESAAKDREDYIRELQMKTLPDRVGPCYFQIL